MIKVLIFLIISVFCLFNAPVTNAESCFKNPHTCDQYPGLSCLADPQHPEDTELYRCLPDPFGTNFGKIQAPAPLAGFLQKDPTGAGGISQFLSNLIALIYTIATIVLIFMILWGAFDWLTSGGEKEKVEAARNRITYALIGMILFAVAFAAIAVLGTFTGFKFFVGQN